MPNCIYKLVRFFFFLFPTFISFVATKGFAKTEQTDSLLKTEETDWALSWLEFIFRGTSKIEKVSENLSQLSALSSALREALSVYSLGMLVIAGFLLAYHVTSMVAETAHSGVVMGKRANRLWAPLRLVFAIGLLVPIGGGLNTGQFLILKIAESGSALASNAWRGITETISNHFDPIIASYRPDPSRLVAVSLEMELCRSIYNQTFSKFSEDSTIGKIGSIREWQKIPSGRLAPEIWRYTNLLHSDIPLCGEYRFLFDYEIDKGSNFLSSLSADLASFSRSNTERMSLQTRSIAEKFSGSFLVPSPVFEEISLAPIIEEQQKILETIAKTLASGKNSDVTEGLKESASSGWISAATFASDILRKQSVFGSLMEQTIPFMQSPLLGYRIFDSSFVAVKIYPNPTSRFEIPAQSEKISIFYSQISSAMRRAREWVYRKALPKYAPALPDVLDVQDNLSSPVNAEAASVMFSRLMKSAALAFGVWNEISFSGKNGAFISPARFYASNPLAGLVENGRRYSAFGHYLTSITGPVLDQSALLGTAVCFYLFGVSFVFLSFAMLFLLPIFPLIRFFIGVLVWFLSVFEALAALPLIALAHLTPVGEGFSGPLARRSYWFLLSLFLRPILTLCGFIVGLVILFFALFFIHSLFSPLLFSLIKDPGDSLITVWAGFAFLYPIVVIITVNVSFKSITWFPDNILNWLNLTDSLLLQESLEQSSSTSVPVPSSVQTNNFFSSAEQNSFSSRKPQESGSVSASTKSAHSLRSALIPAYKEPSESPQTADAYNKQEAISAMQSKVESGGAAMAKAGATTAFASATAVAKASVDVSPTVQKEALFSHEEIKKAIDPLSKIRNEKEFPLQKDSIQKHTENSEREEKTKPKSQVSPEQSSSSYEKETDKNS